MSDQEYRAGRAAFARGERIPLSASVSFRVGWCDAFDEDAQRKRKAAAAEREGTCSKGDSGKR